MQRTGAWSDLAAACTWNLPDLRSMHWLDLDLDPAYEHGVLADIGSLTVEETALSRGSLAYLPTGCATLTVANTGDEPARCLVLGGPPFQEDILMWWNFVARTHDEIVAAREEWMAHSERFGEVEGYAGEVQHLPAPVMPAPAPADATLGKVVQMSEFQAIRETLRACNGSRIETARRLGISERTLRYRLAKAREEGEEIVQPHSWARAS